MDQANSYTPPGAPLPTVAHDRGHGITSIRVYCEGLYCPHWRVFSFDELKVPDELPVIHIPARAPFRVHEMREPKGASQIGMAEEKTVRAVLQPVYEKRVKPH